MKQENEARAAVFEALMQRVAEEFSKVNGSEWVFAGPEEKNSVRPYGRIERMPEIEGLPPSRRLALHVQQYRDGYGANAKERIKVSVSWPRDASGAYRGLRDYGIIGYNESEPEISIAASADPVRIAKDIQRRLIVAGNVEAHYSRVLERQAHDAAYRDRKSQLAAELPVGKMFSLACVAFGLATLVVAAMALTDSTALWPVRAAFALATVGGALGFFGLAVAAWRELP